MVILKEIFLYNDNSGIDFKKINSFLKETIGKKIKINVINSCSFIKVKGIIFNFINTQYLFQKQTSKKNIGQQNCHIAVTKKIFATFDEFKNLHIRAAIFSYPSIISISGIVQGPAKPRDYYIHQQRFASIGMWPLKEKELDRRFKGKFIDYGDKRIIEVVKGYILQALFYHVTGWPFCNKKSCRLFNAHWQKDLIFSQIKSAKLCVKHKAILQKIKK